MSRFNTGNPIDSADPRDRSDNTKNLDQALNNQNDTWTDRFGFERPTVAAAIDPTGLAQTAVEAKVAAEAARDGAFSNAEVYTTVTAGLADTADGDQFQVVDLDTDEIVRYRNDAGSAEELFRTPTAENVTRTATTVIDLFFDDELYFDANTNSLLLPSGLAVSNNTGAIKPFVATTLALPATFTRASYVYFDYSDDEEPFKIFDGSGNAQPRQNGSLKKVGSFYKQVWSNSEYSLRYTEQPRVIKTPLKNVIPNGGGDARSTEANITLYGDLRPTSLDNAPFVDAPAQVRAHGIEKMLSIEAGGELVGNFLEFPISYKTKNRFNIFLSFSVYSLGGNWDFGAANGPFYYLQATNEQDQTYTVQQGGVTGFREISANHRVYFISFFPSHELLPLENYSRILLGMRAVSTSETFYFGGFWCSLSAGLGETGLGVTLDETYWPDWTKHEFLPSPATPALELSALESIAKAVSNPLHSVQLRLIGDSITWGTGASGVAESQPRSQSLTDPRNNLTSRTWANLLRDYIGSLMCGVLKNRADLGDGGSVDSHEVNVAPKAVGVRYIHPTTGVALSEPVTATSGNIPTATYHGYTVDIGTGSWFNNRAIVEIDLVGDNFQVVYAQFTSTETELNSIDVYVDDTLLDSFSFVGASPVFNTTSPRFEIPFGRHKVQLKLRDGNTVNFRLEGFIIEQKLVFWNDGIIGSATSTWVPPSGLLPDAMSESDEFYIVQLGTNNRGANNTSRKQFESQYRSIIDFLLDNNKKVVIAASCVATVENESREGVYDIHMNDVAATLKRIADDYGLDFINQYAYTLQHYLDGEDILPDGLHPNDAGHRIMFDNIKQRLIGAS